MEKSTWLVLFSFSWYNREGVSRGNEEALMALLSRKVDYALMILSYLHHRQEGGCARVITDRFGLKKSVTAKILKLLCRRGLVKSHRGIHGGYVLARPAEEIHLDELLTLLDEPFHLADCNRASPDSCLPGEVVCSFESVCPVRGAIAEVDRRIRDVLATVTLADVFRAPEAGAGCIQYGLEVALRDHDRPARVPASVKP
jgi:Rrf2 family cysteine metabolism transcriptional repressor